MVEMECFLDFDRCSWIDEDEGLGINWDTYLGVEVASAALADSWDLRG